MNQYEKQANEFLKKAGVTFEVKFLRHGKYFPDDKETRDIYEFTLRKRGRNYTATFGQSIEVSGWKLRNKNTGQFPKYIWLSEFKGNTRKEFINFLKKKFGGGVSAWSGLEIIKPKVPTAYDILSCMPTSYSGQTFNDFCEEFGYNADSRTAERIFNRCQKEIRGLEILFTEEELEGIREIQ